jgi:hypothetical protein
MKQRRKKMLKASIYTISICTKENMIGLYVTFIISIYGSYDVIIRNKCLLTNFAHVSRKLKQAAKYFHFVSLFATIKK